jgi:hypothetical protein
LHFNGLLSLHEAVDELQAYAEQSGLVAAVGQEEVQALVSWAFAGFAVDFLQEPECGEDANDIMLRWELADPRDAWRHTGERPPPENVRNSDVSAKPANKPQRLGPARSTIDAFNHVVSLGDPEHLARWLRDHSDVAANLLEGVAKC